MEHRVGLPLQTCKRRPRQDIWRGNSTSRDAVHKLNMVNPGQWAMPQETRPMRY